MRVLLVKPVGSRKLVDIAGRDLGFAYLGAYLAKAGVDVSVMDAPQEGVGHEELCARVVRDGVDIVGFKVFTKDVPSVRQSAKLIKTRSSRTLIVAGGPHITAVPHDAPRHMPEVDFFFAGEAERALPMFVELMDRYRKAGQWNEPPEGLEKVPGLVWRRDGEVRVNPQDFVDLSTLEMPKWDLFPLRRYRPYALRTRGPYIPVQTSRGCPYRCTYCTVARINGRRLRTRPVSKIIEELRYLRERWGIQHFSVIDDDFLGPKKHTEELLDALIASGLKYEWEASSNGIRLNRLSPDLIRKLERAGCYAVAVGAESGSPRTLKRMKKQLTVEEIEYYTGMLAKNSSMWLHGFFILGFPGETLEDIFQTIALALRLPLHTANFFAFTPHPGTEIYNELLAQGRIQELDFDNFLYEVPTIQLDGVSKVELNLALKAAYTLFHLRPTSLKKLFSTDLRTAVMAIQLGLNLTFLPKRRIF